MLTATLDHRAVANVSSADLGAATASTIEAAVPDLERHLTSVTVTLREAASVSVEISAAANQSLLAALLSTAVCDGTITCTVVLSAATTRRRLALFARRNLEAQATYSYLVNRTYAHHNASDVVSVEDGAALMPTNSSVQKKHACGMVRVA